MKVIRKTFVKTQHYSQENSLDFADVDIFFCLGNISTLKSKKLLIRSVLRKLNQ